MNATPPPGSAGPQRQRAIESAANPLLVRLRKERRDPGAYRRTGELWLEGDHLCEAWIDRGRPVLQALVAERAWTRWAADAAIERRMRERLARVPEVLRLPDALFDGVSRLESPGHWALRVAMPPASTGPESLRAGQPTLVLDRLQDPGNVGSLLRSAAAFGFGQVVALAGTVALWAPKVLRSGMGAHLALHLVEGVSPEGLAALGVPLVATGSHEAVALDQAALPWPLAWVMGHEGQGVDDRLRPLCGLTVAIPQPGGQESLNVGVAGAICLYESVRRTRAGAQ